jgi:hypothetical protein
VPVEYLLFREEGHELVRVRNKEIFVEHTARWLATWLSAGQASSVSSPSVAARARPSAPAPLVADRTRP